MHYQVQKNSVFAIICRAANDQKVTNTFPLHYIYILNTIIDFNLNLKNAECKSAEIKNNVLRINQVI